MSTDRFVVLGLGHVRSAWFRDVAQWSNTAAVPAEFIKCVSAEELRSRLGSGRPISAVLLDASLPATDRDLIDAARHFKAAVLVVNDGRVDRDWLDLGATAVVPAALTPRVLLEALVQHAKPVRHAQATPPITAAHVTPTPPWSGQLVAVTGSGGTGSSIVSMALSQALASDPRYSDLVLLADFALNADQAVLHDARETIPGVQELTEAFRSGSPSTKEVAKMVFTTDRGNYHLLLGLRRHKDWSGIRKRAFAASLESLLGAYRFVVADVDSDVEGEDQTGRPDIDERNLMARTTLDRADVVLVVGEPSVKGMHALTRTLGRLLSFGVSADSVITVVNRAPRRHKQRVELSRWFDQLIDTDLRDLAPPLFVSNMANVDRSILLGTPLAAAMGKPLALAVRRCVLESNAPATSPAKAHPQKVAPGSLGSFFEDDPQHDHGH